MIHMLRCTSQRARNDQRAACARDARGKGVLMGTPLAPGRLIRPAHHRQ